MTLSTENKEWRLRFVSTYGRSPRILHIGNIANNAYNNAKLLRAAGADSDVICYDNYHSMGCPEWEDAEFTGVIKDDFRPVWCDLAIKNFTRPSWFVQGPQQICLRYLLAKSAGHTAEAESLWQALALANRTKAQRPALLWQRWKVAVGSSVMSALARVYHFSQGSPTMLFPQWSNRLRRWVPGWQMLFAPLLGAGWRAFASATSAAVQFGRHTGLLAYARPSDEDAGLFAHRKTELLAIWARQFPELADQLQESELDTYQSSIELWRRLFRYYDIVIGYSTDGIWPLLAGKPYLAFEHGTLREIPYQPTPQGRHAALTYRNAAHVFVTNFDCIPSAQRLAPGRFTLINHPYDEDHGMCADGWLDLRERLLVQLDADLICFFPTRHDWVPGTGYADKANDVFLHAIAQMRRTGLRIGVVCCEWGNNVAQSRQLVADQGMAPYVLWERPMAIVKFERMARACDLVVDQFKLGAFGGIVFKAMAVGAPILTFLDEKRLLEQYPEVPPVINCRTTTSIVEALSVLAHEPSSLRAMGEASRAWIKRHHGKQNTVNLQFDQFRRMLDLPTDAPAAPSLQRQ